MQGGGEYRVGCGGAGTYLKSRITIILFASLHLFRSGLVSLSGESVDLPSVPLGGAAVLRRADGL